MTTIHLKGTDGRPRPVSRLLLFQLQFLTDLQLRQLDYDPASVTAACLYLERQTPGCCGEGPCDE